MDRHNAATLAQISTPRQAQDLVQRPHGTTVRVGADGQATITVHRFGKLDASYASPSLLTVAGDTLTAAA